MPSVWYSVHCNAMDSEFNFGDIKSRRKKWQELFGSSLPQDRFQCISMLEDIVKRKKGAYTESDRFMWLYIILACMYAPDSYFSKQPASEPALLQEKLQYFFACYNDMRIYSSGLYAYIDCAKSRFLLSKKRRKSSDKPTQFQAALLNKFKEEIRAQAMQKGSAQTEAEKKALKDRTDEKYRDFYLSIESGTMWFTDPILFVFLPYILFYELSTCEGLIPEEPPKLDKNGNEDYSNAAGPFTIPQLNPDTLRWSIRSSPFNIMNEDSYHKLVELYEFVEYVVYKTAMDIDPHSIGQAACQAWFHYLEKYKEEYAEYLEERRQSFRKAGLASSDEKFKEIMEERDKNFQSLWECSTDFEDEEASFCIPLLNHDVWASRIYDLLAPGAMSKKELKQNMENIFSLTLRQESPQTPNTLNRENLPAYSKDDLKIVLGKSEDKTLVSFFDFLVAIGRIYSPAYFQKENPFDTPDLKQAIETIAGALYPNCRNEFSLETMWYHILSRSSGTHLQFMVNPSGILAEAILLQVMKSVPNGSGFAPAGHSTFEILNSTSFLALLERELSSCMLSDDTIMSDIKHMTGVAAHGSGTCAYDTFRLWEFWVPLGKKYKKSFDAIVYEIKKKPHLAYSVLTKIAQEEKVDLKFNLPNPDFPGTLHYQNTPALLEQKERLLAAINLEYAKTFEAQALDDVRYIMLLYHLFEAARNEMYSTIFKLCLKFLPLL